MKARAAARAQREADASVTPSIGAGPDAQDTLGNAAVAATLSSSAGGASTTSSPGVLSLVGGAGPATDGTAAAGTATGTGTASVTGSATATATATGPTTGLAPTVDALVAKSPILADSLARAQAAGWTIRLGTPGGGTAADRGTKIVTLDPSTSANPMVAVQLIAHELGHANYTLPDAPPIGAMSREEYVRVNVMRHLRDEAEATISELRVRDELQTAGAGVMPISGATAPQKITLWEQFKAGTLTREALVEQLATLFGHGERPSGPAASGDYWDYYAQNYGTYWDANHR
ncbi:MAG: hypothetical protein ABMB14_03815 [Myxococcota bacterium]